MANNRSFKESTFAIIAELAGGKPRASNIRKRWLLFPNFQMRVILFGVTVGTCCLVFTYLANTFLFWRSRAALLEAGVPGAHPVFFFLTQQQRLMGFTFFLVMGLAVISSVIIGTLFSHRIVGPLYRLREYLIATAKGKTPQRLELRDKDYFQDLAEAYNEELEARGAIPKRAKPRKKAA